MEATKSIINETFVSTKMAPRKTAPKNPTATKKTKKIKTAAPPMLKLHTKRNMRMITPTSSKLSVFFINSIQPQTFHAPFALVDIMLHQPTVVSLVILPTLKQHCQVDRTFISLLSPSVFTLIAVHPRDLIQLLPRIRVIPMHCSTVFSKNLTNFVLHGWMHSQHQRNALNFYELSLLRRIRLHLSSVLPFLVSLITAAEAGLEVGS